MSAEPGPNAAFQVTGTVDTSEIDIDFSQGRKTNVITVINRHGTQIIFVHLPGEDGTFPAQANATPVLPNGAFEFRLRVNQIKLSSSGAATNYHVVATLE